MESDLCCIQQQNQMAQAQPQPSTNSFEWYSNQTYVSPTEFNKVQPQRQWFATCKSIVMWDNWDFRRVKQIMLTLLFFEKKTRDIWRALMRQPMVPKSHSSRYDPATHLDSESMHIIQALLYPCGGLHFVCYYLGAQIYNQREAGCGNKFEVLQLNCQNIGNQVTLIQVTTVSSLWCWKNKLLLLILHF